MNHSGSGAQKDPGGSAEADIGDITIANNARRNQVINLWNERKNIKEISDSTGLSLKEVGRILKATEKKFARKRGIQP